MKEDLRGRHCPVHHSGADVSKRVSEDIEFTLNYINEGLAILDVGLIVVGGVRLGLFGFRMYFCVCCGSFIGFDNSCSEGVCWICEAELENDYDFEGFG